MFCFLVVTMAEGKVTLVFEPKLGLPPMQPKAFEASTTVGSVVSKLKKAPAFKDAVAPQQQVLLFVTIGSDAFMPAPDQTIGDLVRMFGQDVDQLGRCLKVAYCTQVFQG